MSERSEIQRIRLGSTQLEISPMGVGAWSWGDRLFWAYGHGYSDADVREAFQISREAGVNFIDTAETYGFGASERLVGELAKGLEGFVIGTKLFPYPWRVRRQDLLHALRKALARLGMTCVDLYQMHWPFPPVSIESWMVRMAEALESGLIRAVGVSNYSVTQMERAHEALAKRGIPLASNQVALSLVDRRSERHGILKACQELGIGFVAYSPLGQGLLTGKYGPGHPPPGVRGLRIRRGQLGKIPRLVDLLRTVGEEQGGKTPAQVALNWVMCKGAIPIPGAKNGQQARENVGALGWRLTEEQIDRLDTASQAFAE